MSDTPPTTDETPDLPFHDGEATADPTPAPPPVTDAGTGRGMDRIVTRLDDDRPPKWAMNWKPIDGEEGEDPSRDHHPARIAGQEDEATTVPADAVEDASDDAPVVPTTTSRTWSASAGRHPQAPRVDATGRVVTNAASTTSHRRPSRGGMGRVLAGWFVALGVGLAWLASTIESDAEPSAAPAASEDRAMLARPLSPAEPDPSPLLLEEIAILQEERVALLAELDAADVLMADHQRLSHELDRTARRWRTATEQLRYLDESLEAAIVEQARLATELATVQRMLDEARDSD